METLPPPTSPIEGSNNPMQDPLLEGDEYQRDDETLGLLSNSHVDKYRPRTEKGSSWIASIFLVVNAALGAGLLNFPAAYDQSGGLLVAVGIQVLLVGFVMASLIILTYCSDVGQSATYQDVIYAMCGRKAQLACAVAVTIYTFGTCITFFIIIGDQWDKFLTFAYGADYCHHWYMSRKFTMITTCVVLVLPLCFPKRIDFLKYASVFGVLAVVYVVILVSVKYFVGDYVPGPIKTSPDHWSDVFIVVPVICFGYQCHLSVVPIYSCMQKRTVPEFTKTLFIAIAICLFAYTGTASFGYLTFGSGVNEDVLLSYNPTTDVLIAVILIAVKMYSTYPILLFVGRAALDQLLCSALRTPPEEVALYEKRRRIVITVIWFAATLFIAVILPDIGVVIDFLGSFAALFAFFFPGLCLLQVLLQGYIHPVQQKHKYRISMFAALFNLIIGAFLFGLVFTQVIMRYVNGTASAKMPSGTCP